MGAAIEAARVPLSSAARALIETGEAELAEAVTGGDDYELLFTAPAEAEPALARIAAELDLPLTRLGEIRAEPGLDVLDGSGRPLSLGSGGYRHF